MNQQSPILPMQEEEEWWLEGRPMHSASGAVPGYALSRHFVSFGVQSHTATNDPITPNYLVDQTFHPSAPYDDSLVLFDGVAPDHFPTTPSVSSLTAAYVSDGEPWDLLSPVFSSHTAPHVTMSHDFYPLPNSYNSTSSPYAGNSYTTYSSGDMGAVAETSQPTLANGTNLTALSANTGRQRVMKTRSTCTTCRKSFTRPSDLNRHAKKHQPGARIYTCSIAGCDYEGSYRKDKLAAHVKNCHT